MATPSRFAPLLSRPRFPAANLLAARRRDSPSGPAHLLLGRVLALAFRHADGTVFFLLAMMWEGVRAYALPQGIRLLCPVSLERICIVVVKANHC